jgi:phosphocarrier protein HPr
MLEKTIIIQNEMGLHARPAATFVQKASQFDAEITVVKDGIEVNGKSIMSLLMLEAEKGSQITLRIEGKDAKMAEEVLSAFLAGQFD